MALFGIQMNIMPNHFKSFNWKTRIAAFKFDVTTLVINVIPEGFYNVGLNRLNMKDTVRAYLSTQDGNGFYVFVDSAKSVIDSITFNGNFKFLFAPTEHITLARQSPK